MDEIAIHYIVSKGYATEEQARKWVKEHGWETVMDAAARGERPEIEIKQRKGE